MGGRTCCVKNCRRRSHDHRGRKIPNGLTFHCFPAWRRNEGGQISALTRRRRKAWVSAVGRSNITFNHIPKSMRVCSRHFISGKPAYEMLESDPDWLPSVHLGHGEGSGRRTERHFLALQATKERKKKKKHSDAEKAAQRESAAGQTLQTPAAAGQTLQTPAAAGQTLQTPAAAGQTLQTPAAAGQTLQTPAAAGQTLQAAAAAGQTLQAAAAAGQTLQAAAAAGGTMDCRDAPTHTGVRRPVVPLWTDVKSLLKSVLQEKPNISVQPGDDTHEQPAAVKTDLSFRDFFKEALEASLDASSRSRTGSSRPPYEVELSIQLPPVKVEKEETSEESSSCLSCVRLQRRVEELEEKLSRLSGRQEDTDGPPVLSEPPIQPNQVLHSPEHAWLQPISPPALLQEGYQDADSDDDSPPLGPAGSQDDSSKRKPRTGRCVPRFQKAWLTTFWFLRYSPTQNLMWCHVCRLHADKAHHNLSLIKGSRMFKVHNIKKHSSSNYHKDSVERHMLHMCDLQL